MVVSVSDHSDEGHGSQGAAHTRVLTGIGDRIRRLRTTRELPQRDLAGQAGLTEEHLAAVEQGDLAPSLAELTRLADVLEVALAELFTDAVPGPAAVVLRDEEVPTVESGDIAVQVLTPRSVIPGMYAARYRLSPASSGVRPVQHDGHDWLYVLSGQLRIEFEQDAVTLSSGDSVSFSSNLPHLLVAPGAAAEFLAVGATLLGDAGSAD